MGIRYVNGVKPGQFGVPKPFYFPFQPSYWLGRPLNSKMKDVRTVNRHVTVYMYNVYKQPSIIIIPH
jgi:hypothetical protein